MDDDVFLASWWPILTPRIAHSDRPGIMYAHSCAWKWSFRTQTPLFLCWKHHLKARRLKTTACWKQGTWSSLLKARKTPQLQAGGSTSVSSPGASPFLLARNFIWNSLLLGSCLPSTAPQQSTRVQSHNILSPRSGQGLVCPWWPLPGLTGIHCLLIYGLVESSSTDQLWPLTWISSLAQQILSLLNIH